MAHSDRVPGSRTRRRDFLKGTAAAGGAVALAGCQGSVARSIVTGEPPQAGDDTFRIGALGPEVKALGESIGNGAKLAAEQLNAQGGIGGKEVEILTGNTRGLPGKAEQEYRRLVAEENCDMTIGTFRTTALNAILPLIADSQRVHMTTGAAGPRPARLVNEQYERYKYHFRPGPINSFDLADAQLEFTKAKAEDFGWETAAVLVENFDALRPFAERLRPIQEVLDVPIFTKTSTNVRTWQPIFDQVEQAGVDICFVFLALTGTKAVTQWANKPYPFEMGGIHVFGQQPNYWEATGGRCEALFTMNAMTPQTRNTERTQKFMKRYMEAFGGAPMYNGPISFDAVNMYNEAVENVGGTEDTDGIINYLEQMEYTNGTIIPRFEFRGPDAEFAHDPVYGGFETGVPVYQQWQEAPSTSDKGISVESGGVQESFYPPQSVSTEEGATYPANKSADYVKPPWMR
jgi:branched-chain amino acid transport system substrate-binding protein